MTDNFYLDDWFIGLIAIVIGTYFWLIFLRKKDKFEPEPFHSLLYVLLIGGASSVFFASIGNDLLNSFSHFKFQEILQGTIEINFLDAFNLFLPSAFTEEFCKYTATYLLIINNKHVNEPVDGIVYAVSVGLGFSLFENLLYITQFGSSIAIPRLLLAVPMHMATAGIWGMYLSSKLVTGEKISYIHVLPLFLVGVLFHGLWNTSATLLGGFFILLAPFVLRFALKHVERNINNLHQHSPFQ